MKIDGGIGLDLSRAAADAKEAEAVGYDGIWVPETCHDPFLPLASRPSTPSASSSAPRSPWPSPAPR